MSQPLQRQSIRNLGVYGLVRQAEVDDNLTPDQTITEVVNFHFDRKGVSTVRPGMLAIADTATTNANAYDCVGLHNASSSVLLAAFQGGFVQRYPLEGSLGGAKEGWTNVLNFSGGSAKIRFADFGGRTVVLIVNSSNQSIRVNDISVDNWFTSWVTSGAPLNTDQFHVADRTASSIEVYKSRLYLAGDTTVGRESRLYFSSVINSNGQITWSPLIDFVDINPGDGENISALKRYSLELVVFKPNYMYRFRTTGLDPDPLIKIGTRSQESVIEGKRGLYFHHESGFYRYSGDYPIEISRAISDFVAAIPFSQYDDIIGWKDTDHIYWSLGNLTISETKQDVLYRNVVVRYTESSDIWTIYSYPSDIRSAGMFASLSTAVIRPVVGFARTINGATFSPNRGVIAALNVGKTDLGETIAHRLVTKWYEWEGIENRKVVNEIIAICEKAQDLHIMYQVDESIEWNELGQIRSFLTDFRKETKPFHRIRFKVSGVTSNESAIFQGLEIISGTNEGPIV